MSKQQGELIVFVVDDEHIISTTLGLILRHQGYDSRSFDKPGEVIKAARLESPDLLITDFVMPEMTGIELAHRVRKTCPRCKVLLFSGQASLTDLIAESEVDEGSIDHFLLKPVHPTVLLKKVEEIMNPLAINPAA